MANNTFLFSGCKITNNDVSVLPLWILSLNIHPSCRIMDHPGILAAVAVRTDGCFRLRSSPYILAHASIKEIKVLCNSSWMYPRFPFPLSGWFHVVLLPSAEYPWRYCHAYFEAFDPLSCIFYGIWARNSMWKYHKSS